MQRINLNPETTNFALAFDRSIPDKLRSKAVIVYCILTIKLNKILLTAQPITMVQCKKGKLLILGDYTFCKSTSQRLAYLDI